MRRLLAILLIILSAGPAWAVLPEEQLSDPALEARARQISRDLRCVVCQNQSIDESDAPLAADLRVLVRERLLAGDTDAEAKAYLVDRYGDYVLLKPAFDGGTVLLWLGPLLALVLGGLGVGTYWRGRASAGPVDPTPLAPDERRRLDALLKDDRL
ncbi:cytochrome c-type biogenesis protein CcmH [Nostoc sp. CHAB 5834]|nr:cytochrome c-type biogenesis protein CcmH [Nostoc sp. CHAB 5834]